MSRFFLPLKSNAAWFTGPETRKSLERRIKNYLLLYDEIIIQDAKYSCSIVENGSFDFLIPANKISTDREKINYFTPGQEMTLFMSPEGSNTQHPVLSGNMIASYEIDYYPIIFDAGLLNEEYFIWISNDLDQNDTRLANKEIFKDKNNLELKKILPENSFVQNFILKSLYFDSLLAYRLNLPFLVDNNISKVIEWKNQQIKSIWKPELKDFFYKTWISLDHPDYTNESWEKIHKIRQSEAGRDYRRMIENITNEVLINLPSISDKRDIENLILKLFHKELVEELKSRLTTPLNATINIGLNFFPYGGIVGALKDITEIAQLKTSWVSLI